MHWAACAANAVFCASSHIFFSSISGGEKKLLQLHWSAGPARGQENASMHRNFHANEKELK